MVPPLTGVFSLSFFRLTTERERQNEINVKISCNTGRFLLYYYIIIIMVTLYFTILGEYDLLHVRDRSRVLHVFGQVLLWLFLLLSTPSPVCIHKNIHDETMHRNTIQRANPV